MDRTPNSLSILQWFCHLIIIVLVEVVVTEVIVVQLLTFIDPLLHGELYAKVFRWVNLFIHKLPFSSPKEPHQVNSNIYFADDETTEKRG